MNIGGLQKTSLLDYPEHISAIIWAEGCNFRCPFCYNKNLVFGTGERISEDMVFSFLEKRKGLLEGVVISGGEPLMQDDVMVFIRKIKQLGFLVKVDTNGSFPDRLKVLFDENLVDYVAMDVKASKKKYPLVCGCPIDLSKIEHSIDLIRKRAPDYEFRTTVVPSLLTREDVVEIAEWLKGSKQWYLQQFKVFSPLVSSKMEKVKAYDPQFFVGLLESVKPFVQHAAIRGV